MPKEKPTEPSLLDLPNEVIELCAKPYQGSTLLMARLARSDKRLRHLLQPELDKRAAKQLMEYIQKPTAENFAKAQTMYQANPRLICTVVKDEVESPAVGWDAEGNIVRRKVRNRSPLQAAAAGVNKMIYEDMTRYIHLAVDINTNQPIGLEAAKTLAAAQLNAQFPNGFAYPPSEYDVDKNGLHFSTLLNAITSDTALRQNEQDVDYDPDRKPNETTKAALAAFREYFRPKEAVDSGHDFNLNHLVKAYELYKAHWNQWNWNQCVVYCVEVIGYLQGLVPPSVAQAFCQGLYYLLEQKKPVELALDVKIWGTDWRVAFYPHSSIGARGTLGRDFLVDIVYGYALAGSDAALAAGVRLRRRLLGNYVEQTHQTLTALSNTLNSQPVVMSNDRSGPRGSA
jgi:hypothetical protein